LPSFRLCRRFWFPLKVAVTPLQRIWIAQPGLGFFRSLLQNKYSMLEREFPLLRHACLGLCQSLLLETGAPCDLR
jgi:hypothetical protein